MLCVQKFIFEIGKDGPFQANYNNIVHLHGMVFRTMFLKPDTVGIIPREGYRFGDRQSIEAFQRLAYIGQTRDDVIHAGGASAQGAECKS